MKFSTLSLVLLVTSCQAINSSIKQSYDILQPSNISIQEFHFITKTIPSQNLIFVDLRSPKQFKKSNIPTSISLNYKQLSQLTNIPDIHKKRIILYDTKKARLRKLYRAFRKIQLSNYQILLNGFQSWQDYQTNTNNNYI